MADRPIQDDVPAGNTERCVSCRHWRSDLSDFVQWAECHRFPPTLNCGMVGAELDRRGPDGLPEYTSMWRAGGWLRTNAAWGCGEFARRAS